MPNRITVGCHDLSRAARFYDAVLTPLGLTRRPVTADGGPDAACWGYPDQGLPSFYVYMPFNRRPVKVGNSSMLTFVASSPAAVDAAHAAALSSGGTDAGPPGREPHVGEGHYCAYMRDVDGNKVHIAYRGGELIAATEALAD